MAGGEEGDVGAVGEAKVMEGGSELGDDELSWRRSSPFSSSPRRPRESGALSLVPPSAHRRGTNDKEEGGGAMLELEKPGGGVTRPIRRSSSRVSSSLEDRRAGGRVTV